MAIKPCQFYQKKKKLLLGWQMVQGWVISLKTRFCSDGTIKEAMDWSGPPRVQWLVIGAEMSPSWLSGEDSQSKGSSWPGRPNSPKWRQRVTFFIHSGLFHRLCGTGVHFNRVSQLLDWGWYFSSPTLVPDLNITLHVPFFFKYFLMSSELNV